MTSYSGAVSGLKSDATPWSLSNSDQPGMALVVTPLIGNNFVSWSLAIKDALEAKDKLGFINGTIKEPVEEADLKKWRPVDSMVKSWVRNSISKEIVETFMFCKSARDLWKEIEERYGAKSGPKFFQLQQDLAALRQGTDTRLVQFLMGLNQTFEVIRSQILSLDPLPSVNKAFAMVVNIETEKEINMSLNGNQVEGSAMLAKGNFRNDNFKKIEDKKTNKMSKFCDHCQQNGHTREGCFKIIGYPEWWKDLKEQKRKNAKKNTSANLVAETPIDGHKDRNSSEYANVIAAIQELAKIVRAKPEEKHVNFSNLGEFASKGGKVDYIPLTNTSWIVDTGASSHMCFNKRILINLRTLESSIPVHLPDGSVQNVKHTGSVVIQGKIHLHIVFYLPNFKYNLLSVNKLVKDNGVSVFFNASSCMIQDWKTRETLVEGRLLDNLYILKHDHDVFCNTARTFETINFASLTNSAENKNSCRYDSVGNCASLLWHQRLGHAPIDVLKHIDGINVKSSFVLPKVCDVCHYAKQHRTNFETSGTRVTHTF
ncbi:uncharacterized protein G2W53_001519 [Senna tora]|uniref:GAG-pre-integrase domain-containing protein n=1 Tax=Senna tora TaxID=362788 RepID=A0A834XG31_9FABA|nr:uncharacterized protein G2W53_001519 [Senna tora]